MYRLGKKFTQIFIYFSKPLRLLYSLMIYEIVNFLSSLFTLCYSFFLSISEKCSYTRDCSCRCVFVVVVVIVYWCCCPTEYRLYTVVPRLVRFIDQLTNWYVRSNRKRIKVKSMSQRMNNYVTFPKKNELPRVGLHVHVCIYIYYVCVCTCTCRLVFACFN